MNTLTDSVNEMVPWFMMLADDLVKCRNNKNLVEEELEKWRSALERKERKLRYGKTECMTANENNCRKAVKFYGENLERVDWFKYYGWFLLGVNFRRSVKKFFVSLFREMPPVQVEKQRIFYATPAIYAKWKPVFRGRPFKETVTVGVKIRGGFKQADVGGEK